MARDEGLEELVRDDLDAAPRLTETPMFGGWAWLLNGNFLCGARQDGLLVRLGPDAEKLLVGMPDMKRMTVGKRQMRGWFWAGPAAYGDDAQRRKLLDAALAYVRALAPK